MRSIFQRVFINLANWSMVLTNHTRMAAQTWWPLFGKTIVSTNSDPRNVIHTDRRLGSNVIQVNQPQNIQLYNRYINGVEHHEQIHMKDDVSHFSDKAWNYILWYFVNTSIVNAYILYCKTSTRQTKRSMLILTFDLRLQWDWLLDFHLEIGRHKLHCTLGQWQLQMKTMKKCPHWLKEGKKM